MTTPADPVLEALEDIAGRDCSLASSGPMTLGRDAHDAGRCQSSRCVAARALSAYRAQQAALARGADCRERMKTHKGAEWHRALTDLRHALEDTGLMPAGIPRTEDAQQARHAQEIAEAKAEAAEEVADLCDSYREQEDGRLTGGNVGYVLECLAEEARDRAAAHRSAGGSA